MNSGCSASNGLGRVLGAGLLDDVVPPHVAVVGPGDLLAGAPHHQDVLDAPGSSRRASSTVGLSAAGLPRR